MTLVPAPFHLSRGKQAPRFDSRLQPPRVRHIFADGGYAGNKLKDALRRISKWTIEIIKWSDTAKGFEVLPRRWVVERTLTWLNRNRRLAKDFEQTIASATAWQAAQRRNSLSVAPAPAEPARYLLARGVGAIASEVELTSANKTSVRDDKRDR